MNILRAESRFARTTVAAVALAMTAGCTTFSRDFTAPTPVKQFPSKTTPTTMERDGTVNPNAAIQIDESAFIVRPVKPQQIELPDFYVHNLAATESGVQDALQLMLEGSGLTLNVEGGARGMERFGATAVQGVKGGLRKVMDRLSDQMGFFWSASDGVVTIEPDQMFVVELPPVLGDDSLSTMSNTITYMGARDTYLDRMARTLVFRANKKVLKSIDTYLEGIRATRSMLVYEIQIFQVDLTDGNQEGVRWNKLNGSSLQRPKLINDGVTDLASATSDLASSFGLTSAGASLGAVIMGPKFSIDILLDFLKTQGSVKTVSQPRLAMLNGSKGSLRVGQTTTYVSKVGSNLGSGISQVTVETKDLRTGLELGLMGEEHDSTIYTRVTLALSELIRFNKYTTLGTDLNLPDVTDRELKTSIRLPAGYTALLGGITVQRETDDRNIGIKDNTKVQEVKRSELVMVVKPTIVRFKRKDQIDAMAAAAPAPEQAASGPKREALLLPKEPQAPAVIEPVTTAATK